MRMSIREPAVAGIFYPAGEMALRDQIESCFLSPLGPGSLPQVASSGERQILGLVCPHAGYIYSGTIAAHAYACLAEDGLPEIAVIIGPNHRSFMPAVALTDEDAWSTPLGDIDIDHDVSRRIIEAYPSAKASADVHRGEHSLEVQVPFLQYLSELAGKSIRIVPLLLGSSGMSEATACVENLSDAIVSAVDGKNVVLIASTDFSHYETGESAGSKDSRAISSIVTLDERGLLRTVELYGITMCGVLPTAVTIAACKKLGAVKAKRIAYGNSGDTSGNYEEVVGYGAVELCK